MRYFDYEKVAREAGITPEQLALLAKRVRQDFPTDDMLYELRLLRLCMAVRDRHVTVQQALDEAEAA